MSRLKGRAALVTGAARGIGAAICQALAAEGAKVVVADVLEAGAATAEALGPAAAFAALDVTDPAAWERAVAFAEQRHGPLSILVNNAGRMAGGYLADLDVEVWRQVLDVNLTGAWLGMRAAIPSMRRAGGGAIVNISSVAGLVGYPNRAAYGASKWALRGLTKAAALEFAPLGVRVNSIHPGPIRTQLTQGYPEDAWAGQAIARFGEPQEVARLAVFLAVEPATGTGEEFLVDGGVVAGPALRSEP
jgi:3alpha(or 20beta)-hydroxysteroid dehydrogenase